MSFQRSGKTPSPEGYRNLGKSRSCQHSGILQDCFHRAGALESLQRFALQAFQRSGKCRQELADRFVLQAFKRQNGTALRRRENTHNVFFASKTSLEQTLDKAFLHWEKPNSQLKSLCDFKTKKL